MLLPPSRPSAPWLMLISRSLLFIGFQALIALLFVLAGHPAGWDESIRWWPIVAALTNFASIFLLIRLFQAEGKRYLEILRFSRQTLGKDLLWMLGVLILAVPIAGLPMTPIATALFGDSMLPARMMFRPLPNWAFMVSFLFPLTIGFAELPTYFGYVMPRLAEQLKNGWLAWALASLMLAAQHCFLPFIFDGRFLLYRLGMFLPFAFFVGLVLKLRPRLLPYAGIIHILIDISALTVYLTV